MVSIETIENAVVQYLDAELIPQLPQGGFQKVLVGTMISIAIKNSESWALKIIENPMLKAIGIVDEDGLIDADLVCEELKKQMPETGMVLEMPVIGKMTFKAADVDKLHDYIQST